MKARRPALGAEARAGLVFHDRAFSDLQDNIFRQSAGLLQKLFYRMREVFILKVFGRQVNGNFEIDPTGLPFGLLGEPGF